MMVPNNRYLRESGHDDPREDFVRLLARIGRPLLYDPAAPRYGLPPWEHDLIEAYYDNASIAFERLEEIGALETIHQPEWPTYNEVPEDRARFGRVLFPRRPDGEVGDGIEFVRQMRGAAERLGVTVRTRCRATGVYVDANGEVVGVEAEGDDGPVRLGARRAVVFASGGFAHNEALRREHLNGLYAGSCAGLTSEGDFVPIAKALRIPLVNMHSAWGSPLVFEHALRTGTELMSNFAVPGDSIVVVNKYGVRIGNEKATYNDRTQTHFVWIPHGRSTRTSCSSPSGTGATPISSPLRRATTPVTSSRRKETTGRTSSAGRPSTSSPVSSPNGSRGFPRGRGASGSKATSPHG